MDGRGGKENLKFVMHGITKAKVRKKFAMACITIRNASGNLISAIISAIHELRDPAKVGRPSKGE